MRVRPAMAAWIAAVALAVGCKDKSAPAGTPAPPAATDAAHSATAKARPRPLVPRAEVEALFGRWLEAQNRGQFAAYAALYGTGFRGVRRSGKKVVRLDLQGWLADRKRMFRRPMKVAASRVQITVSSAGATVRFVQDWSSGSYRDVGTKVLDLARTPAGLRITAEDMLTSVLLDGSATVAHGTAELLLLSDGLPVVAAGEDDWGVGPARLVAGQLADRDPTCDSDPPEYGEDRYWTCESSDPSTFHSHFKAARSVNLRALPAKVAAWRGRAIALYRGDGTRCDATVRELELWGEWITTSAMAGEAGDPDAEVAAGVLDHVDPVVRGDIRPPCKDAVFARDGRLPDPPTWDRASAIGTLADLARADLADDLFVQELRETTESYGLGFTASVTHVAPPKTGGPRFIAAEVWGIEDCRKDGYVTWIWRVDHRGTAPVLREVFRLDEELAIQAVADVTGDGTPEIVTHRGVLYWRGDEYVHAEPYPFPRDVDDTCHCECGD